MQTIRRSRSELLEEADALALLLAQPKKEFAAHHRVEEY